jgi:hypothetical protein
VGPEVAASVCGPDWPASLFPWDVVPATAQELPQVQLLAYKPGAGQLPAWWTTPHRYAMLDSLCNQAKQVQVLGVIDSVLNAGGKLAIQG